VFVPLDPEMSESDIEASVGGVSAIRLGLSSGTTVERGKAYHSERLGEFLLRAVRESLSKTLKPVAVSPEPKTLC